VSRLFRFGFFGLLACGSSAATTLAVTLGGESDTITRAPAVSSFVVQAVDRQGQAESLADGGWKSGSTIDLADLSQTAVASIQLTASESSGSAVVWGAVPFATLGAFNGLTIPLFIQRKGDTARMPGSSEDAAAPLLAASPRAIYVANDDRPLTAYDMLLLDAIGGTCPAAPAKSFALVVSPKPNTDGNSVMAWRISDDDASVMGLSLQCTVGYEKFVNLDGGQSGSIAWGDFAGGQTVMGDDGSAYIVGPSRASSASGTIFKIAPDPDASTLVNALITSIALTPRKGAATAWAPNRGVFIYGGSAASSSVGEVVSASGAVTEISTTLDGGVDTREGLAAIAFDSNKMLLAGDDQQPTLIDLSCPGCATQNWGVATGVKLVSPALFALGNGAFLLIGDDTSGATHLFRLSDSASPEKPLKIARHGARAIKFETGQVVIIGGGNATPESYVD